MYLTSLILVVSLPCTQQAFVFASCSFTGQTAREVVRCLFRMIPWVKAKLPLALIINITIYVLDTKCSLSMFLHTSNLDALSLFCFLASGFWLVMMSLKQGSEATVSLKLVLHQFSSDPITSSQRDISPHLFFICLLHLANEHCLSLHDSPTLDELEICIPSSAFVK